MSKADYPEALEASGLLEEFRSIRSASAGDGTESDEDACAVFFDKAYLTMAEFLAPIGGVLVRRKRPVESTILGFLSSAIKTAKPKEKSAREKLQDLLGQEVAAQAVALEHLRRIESIHTFLNRIGR